MRSKKAMWITAAVIAFVLAAGLFICDRTIGRNDTPPKNDAPPEFELNIYTDSTDPAAGVHAEYYSILGIKPYYSAVAELDTRMWSFFLDEFLVGNAYSEGKKLPPILDPKASYSSKAGYAIVGNYLSVTRALTVSGPDSEHPVTTFSAETYNMRDVHCYWLWDLLHDSNARDVFYQAIADGKCKLVYPERDIPGAVDVLRECVEEGTWNPDEDYFLTETGLRLFLNDRGHENGDYWLFEIAYEDLGDVRESLDVVRVP